MAWSVCDDLKTFHARCFLPWLLPPLLLHETKRKKPEHLWARAEPDTGWGLASGKEVLPAGPACRAGHWWVGATRSALAPLSPDRTHTFCLQVG